MRPYYERGGITIYNADCRDVLPALREVDVVLTDPPYGIEGASGLRTKDKRRAKGDYSANFDDTPDYIRDIVVPVITDLIERVGCVVLTPGNRNLSLYPQPDSFGAFYQPAAVALQTFGNLDAQPIFYYGKNASKRHMGVPCSYRLTESPPRNGHPCPKPPRIWQLLLSNISKPGQMVLDPFMGSGTTLLAAKNLNRRAMGIELEERYCEIAAKRLSQEVLPLWNDEVAS
jgi:DNA modification methylase